MNEHNASDNQSSVAELLVDTLKKNEDYFFPANFALEEKVTEPDPEAVKAAEKALALAGLYKFYLKTYTIAMVCPEELAKQSWFSYTRYAEFDYVVALAVLHSREEGQRFFTKLELENRVKTVFAE
jgi:hypothetical protein